MTPAKAAYIRGERIEGKQTVNFGTIIGPNTRAGAKEGVKLLLDSMSKEAAEAAAEVSFFSL